jgi:hypothetical protein
MRLAAAHPIRASQAQRRAGKSPSADIDQADFPREIAEAALAHVAGDATERAYRRGDALEKRRALMTEWATFISTLPAKEQK